MTETHSRPRKIDIFILAGILALGIFLRLPPAAFSENGSLPRALQVLHPQPKMIGVGFDEGLYRSYVNALIRGGLTSYPDMVEDYVHLQAQMDKAILPPVRFLYIFAAYLWHCCFGTEALPSLAQVASFFSVLTLILSAIFARRLGGRAVSLGVTALMSVAPTQIHMSQHALIDGFFAFWALLCLWLLWENLRAQPGIAAAPSPQSSSLGRGGREAPGEGQRARASRQWIWVVAFAVALALLVLTKENSFFVWCALVTIIVINRWLEFGTVKRELLLAMIVGPLLGVVVLVFLAGGFDNLLATYRLLVTKASQMPYAILTGDGPWHRYLVDLMLVSPSIVLLALGTIFRLDRGKKPELYLSIFIAASYLIMCNVKYGMNLRYANMWDMPLRYLAFAQIGALAAFAQRYRTLVTALAVVVIMGIELRQYLILAVQYPLYELISHDLLQALKILK